MGHGALVILPLPPLLLLLPHPPHLPHLRLKPPAEVLELWFLVSLGQLIVVRRG